MFLRSGSPSVPYSTVLVIQLTQVTPICGVGAVEKFVADPAGPASELLPRVHLVVSLLKRWLLGTHQGAVSPAHLDYYLDEFTFRFNRRRSRHRGKLFYRLVQQAVSVQPAPYRDLVKHVPRRRRARKRHHN